MVYNLPVLRTIFVPILMNLCRIVFSPQLASVSILINLNWYFTVFQI